MAVRRIFRIQIETGHDYMREVRNQDSAAAEFVEKILPFFRARGCRIVSVTEINELFGRETDRPDLVPKQTEPQQNEPVKEEGR